MYPSSSSTCPNVPGRARISPKFLLCLPPQQPEPTFPPPGTYIVTMTSYTHVSAGFPPQTPFHMHPHSFPQTEALTLPDHGSIPPAADFLFGTGEGSTTLHSYGNDSRDNQLLEKDLTETTRQSNVRNSYPCKLCNIICNSNDAFEKHIQGKKHQKNLGKQVVVDASVTQKPTAEEITSESNVSNTFPCELCNIICNNIDAFEKHVQGKMHQKNLGRQVVVRTSVPQKASVGETTPVTSVVTSGLEMEKKNEMLLQNGATASSLLFCTMCNVGCNDEGVFRTHLAGKKHASQVVKQATIRHVDGVGTSNLMPSLVPPKNDILEEAASKTQTTQHPWCEICKISFTSQELLKIHMAGKGHRKNLSRNIIGPCSPAEKQVIGAMENTEAIKVDAVNLENAENMAKITRQVDPNNQETENGQSVMCAVCNIICTSLGSLNIHVAGKKHRRALEKSNRIIGAAGPVELQKSKKKMKRLLAYMDDVETKRQKMVEAGAALHSLRVCRLCDVVCHTPELFIYHLAGQKHHAMEKKKAAIIASIKDPDGYKGNADELQK